MTYGFRKRPRKQRGVKPSAPIDPPLAWTTVIIRRDHYTMLRELALYFDCTIGQAAMTLIADEFNRILKTVDPKYKGEGVRPTIFPTYSRHHPKPAKRVATRNLKSTLPDRIPEDDDFDTTPS